MINNYFVLQWMIRVGLDDDPDWPPSDHPDWVCRPSLFEIQLADALDLSYEVQVKKKRNNGSLHGIVTRAIAHTVPVDQVSNAELIHILFGSENSPIPTAEETRAARNFRNEERSLKVDTAARYILEFIYTRKIQPAEGARLWYFALTHASGIEVIKAYLKRNKNTDSISFARDKDALVAATCEKFEALWLASLKKSETLPGHSRDEVRGFMDFCAFVQWQESKVKRNPLIGIKQMISLRSIYNEFPIK